MASPMFQILKFSGQACPQTPLACCPFNTHKFEPLFIKFWIRPTVPLMFSTLGGWLHVDNNLYKKETSNRHTSSSQHNITRTNPETKNTEPQCVLQRPFPSATVNLLLVSCLVPCDSANLYIQNAREFKVVCHIFQLQILPWREKVKKANLPCSHTRNIQFSSLTQMKDDHATNAHYFIYAYFLGRGRENVLFELGSKKEEENIQFARGGWHVIETLCVNPFTPKLKKYILPTF